MGGMQAHLKNKGTIDRVEQKIGCNIFELYVGQIRSGTSPILDKVIKKTLNTDFLDQLTKQVDLNELKTKLEAMHQRFLSRTKEELAYYVPLEGTDRYHSNTFDLESKIESFVTTTATMGVQLLMGQAGSGKTLFCQYLTQQYNQKYLAGKTAYIALYIYLPLIQNPTQGLIEKHLYAQGFNESEIIRLKKGAESGEFKFLFMLDAYDEARQFESFKAQYQQNAEKSITQVNLWVTNQLEQWNPKVIISCRSTAFENISDGAVFFKPYVQGQLHNNLFDEWYSVPFSPEKVTQYITQYIPLYLAKCLLEWTTQYKMQSRVLPTNTAVQEDTEWLQKQYDYLVTHKVEEGRDWSNWLASLESTLENKQALLESWKKVKAQEASHLQASWLQVETFNRHLDEIYGFRETIKTPFLLRIAIEIMPEVAQQFSKEIEEGRRACVVPLDLYEQFVERYFNRQREKMVANGIPVKASICRDFRQYSIALAQKMEEKGITVVEYEAQSTPQFGLSTEQSEWDPFFRDNADIIKIREGCPLHHVGNRWFFWHDTIRIYFLSRGRLNALLAMKSDTPSMKPSATSSRASDSTEKPTSRSDVGLQLVIPTSKGKISNNNNELPIEHPKIDWNNNNNNQNIRTFVGTVKFHRTGLKNVTQQQFNTLITALPKNVSLGKAVDDGGCFFDALAQALNVIQRTTEHTEKTLRMLCHRYYLANKAKVNEWNKEDYQGIDKGEEYLLIQYTQQEIDDLFQGKGAPVWGRPHIEGHIICEALQLKGIDIIEILENPENKNLMASHQKVTQEGSKPIEDQQWTYDSSIPVLVVSQQDLHFVPVLPSEFMQAQETYEQFSPVPDLIKSKNSATTEFFKRSTSPINSNTGKPNAAMKAFIQSDRDARLFKTPYHSDLLKYLLHSTNNRSRCFRYVFTDDSNKVNSFQHQLKHLILLSHQLQRPAIFMSKVPATEEHWIAGVFFNCHLLILNPAERITQPDFYQSLVDLQRKGENQLLDSIILSDACLQKDLGAMASCGPLCMEWVMHICENPPVLEAIQEMLEKPSGETVEHQGVRCIFVNTACFELPPLLIAVQGRSLSDYPERLITIRKTHLEYLTTRAFIHQDASDFNETEDYWNGCLDPPEQQLVRRFMLDKKLNLLNLLEDKDFQAVASMLSAPSKGTLSMSNLN